jgi:hypothetical protein
MLGATLYYISDIIVKLNKEFSEVVGIRIARRVEPVPQLCHHNLPVGAPHLVLAQNE